MDIQKSLERILQRDAIVTDLFYEIFLDRHPDVQKYFVGVDLKHQAVILKMALMTIASYHQHHYPAAEQYLKLLGHKHHLREIPADLFPDFCDCLLETLKRFHGTEWSPELRREWKAALDEATAVMRQGYDEQQFVY